MKPRFVLGVLVICVSFVFAESRNRNLIDISGLVFTEPEPAVGKFNLKVNIFSFAIPTLGALFILQEGVYQNITQREAM